MKPSDLPIAFHHDVDKVCASLIEAMGLKYTEQQAGLSDPLLRWLDFTRRYITPERRDIDTSKRLPKLLPPDIERAYFDLITKIRLGQDINPYQGRGLIELHDTSGTKRQQRTDLLFADWGIHHLHLTLEPIQEGRFFSARSSWLLFGIFEHGLARLIDVRPHNESLVFSSRDLLQAVTDRWPNFMDQYRLKGATIASEREPSAEDIDSLRKGGITSVVQINGSVYMGPGMGVTTASTSNRTSMDMMKVRRAAKTLAEMVERPGSQFAQHAAANSLEAPKWELCLTPKGLAVYEAKSNHALVLPRTEIGREPSFLTELHELLVPQWSLEPLERAINQAEGHVAPPQA